MEPYVLEIVDVHDKHSLSSFKILNQNYKNWHIDNLSTFLPAVIGWIYCSIVLIAVIQVFLTLSVLAWPLENQLLLPLNGYLLKYNWPYLLLLFPEGLKTPCHACAVNPTQNYFRLDVTRETAGYTVTHSYSPHNSFVRELACALCDDDVIVRMDPTSLYRLFMSLAW